MEGRSDRGVNDEKEAIMYDVPDVLNYKRNSTYHK